MNRTIKTSLLAAALSVTLFTRQAEAIPLPPGAVVVPTALGAGPAFGLLTTLPSPFVISAGLSGTVTTKVYNDPVFNPLGLTFTYDITLDVHPGTEALARLGLPDWSGFLADADQTLVGVVAKTADRTALPGDIIGFNFGPNSVFTSGLSSTTLILMSNATDYKASRYGVQSGLTTNGDTYAPTTTVPEGSLTVMLLGLGFLSLRTFRKLLPAC